MTRKGILQQINMPARKYKLTIGDIENALTKMTETQKIYDEQIMRTRRAEEYLLNREFRTTFNADLLTLAKFAPQDFSHKYYPAQNMHIYSWCDKPFCMITDGKIPSSRL